MSQATRRRAPKTYWSESLGRRLLAIVSETGSVTQACNRLGIAGRWTTVWRWQQRGVTVDGKSLADALDEARKNYCATVQDALVETLQQLDHAVQGDSSDAARVSALRAKAQGYQWLLSKLMPRLYGDRVEHHGRVDTGITVKVVSYARPTVELLKGQVERVEIPSITSSNGSRACESPPERADAPSPLPKCP